MPTCLKDEATTKKKNKKLNQIFQFKHFEIQQIIFINVVLYFIFFSDGFEFSFLDFFLLLII